MKKGRGKGKVYLVGAGPGDTGLFTLKGLECLRMAQVVIYDNLVNPKLISYAKKGAQLIFAGKSWRGHTLSQGQINKLLLKKAAQGKIVVRLKGGDPILFGRGAEEAMALARAGVLFEIVPGVTSALAVPAYAGIPLTHRDISSSLTIITGHEDPLKKSSSIQWDKLIQKKGTLVVLMGIGNLFKITEQLLAAGGEKSTPVAVIRNGTSPNQEILAGNLGNIARKVNKKGLQPPAIIVIGKVVNLRKRLDWFNKQDAKAAAVNKPALFNKRVLVTRPAAQAEEFARLLRAQGAKVIKMPLIRIVQPENLERVDRGISNIGNYDWVVLTSVNGVDFFVQRLKKNKVGKDRLKGIRFAAIGSRTAQRLKISGLKAELVPERFRQEDLGKEIIKRVRQGARILLAQAQGSRDILARMLEARGFKVSALPIYRTRPVTNHKHRLKEMIKKNRIDIITLTSSSCVEAFVNLTEGGLKKQINKVVVAVIGPVCRDTAKKSGLKVDIVPKDYTIEGLTKALVDYYS